MSDQQCDIHDVTKAASDLMSFGCTTSATYLDSVMQLKFSSLIANYVNEVIRDVNDGVISAWEGMQELRNEYDELANKSWFYIKNGAGIAGGSMQIGTAIEMTVASRGVLLPVGVIMGAHGYNNMHEGGWNIHDGNSENVGPVRKMYRSFLKDDYKGDMTYYTMDLMLAGFGLGRKIPKEGIIKLFRNMPEDFERAYKQTGKIALALEALVDGITMGSIYDTNEKHKEKNHTSNDM